MIKSNNALSSKAPGTREKGGLNFNVESVLGSQQMMIAMILRPLKSKND